MDIAAITQRQPEPAPRPAPAASAPRELEAAAKSFEAYFTSSLLSTLAKTAEIGGSGSPSREKQLAWSVLTQTVGEKMAGSQSLGLSRQLLENWARSTGQNPAGGPGPAPASPGTSGPARPPAGK